MSSTRMRVDDFEIVSRSAALIPAIPLDRMMLAAAEREAPDAIPVFKATVVAEIFFGHGVKWLYAAMSRHPVDAGGYLWVRPRQLRKSALLSLADVERLIHHLFAVDVLNFRQFMNGLQVVMWIAKVHDVYA